MRRGSKISQNDQSYMGFIAFGHLYRGKIISKERSLYGF